MQVPDSGGDGRALPFQGVQNHAFLRGPGRVHDPLTLPWRDAVFGAVCTGVQTTDPRPWENLGFCIFSVREPASADAIDRSFGKTVLLLTHRLASKIPNEQGHACLALDVSALVIRTAAFLFLNWKHAMPACRCIDEFAEILETVGASAALGYLNSGVPHRYTAVYRLVESKLVNVAIHDKAGEVRPEFLVEVPFEVSFCQFVIRDGEFRTDDSTSDHRLDGHAYQGVMVSYHGVPILWQHEIWGSICHFDVVSLSLPDEEFELLKAAAALWPRTNSGGRAGAKPLGQD